MPMHTRRVPQSLGGVRIGQPQRGVSLFEALVAVLIVAVGVLGMLSLQLDLLAQTQSSTQRSQAIRIIEDLSERVKSNPSRFAVLASYVLPDWEDASSAVAVDCKRASCTAEQLALWDIHEWRRHVALSMPGAQALSFLSESEAGHQVNRRQLGVMLAWRMNERAEQAADARYTTPFVVGGGLDSPMLACPQQMICHLTYIQP